ncbi:MAG: PIN domain nuclease [Anaerolineae bacterium]|nr:PIN domain nuclease [Anaerolineae bacterium]MDW8102163.1 PIN domain nuclease [Anaerolineae bacterium]
MAIILRFVGMVVFGIIGWQMGVLLAGGFFDHSLRYILIIALASGALGFIVTPWVTIYPFRWVKEKIKILPARNLVAGFIGLIVGLIISALVSIPISFLPSPLGKILPSVATVILTYLATMIAVIRQNDILRFLGSRYSLKGEPFSSESCILLDTSVIIDGRIVDISRTGFLRGTLLIPRFVLNELHHIADSQDILRRNRGRRGLEMLEKLRREAIVPVQVTDMDVEEAKEVDEKLILLARKLQCPILTNDYNLNRVARLQGVEVLNLNELANAVKTVVLPGESLTIHIIQEGKEPNQGVGYLDDGTMVVVENGRRFINSTIEVTVTKVLQTDKGRIIFAQPDGRK